MNSTNKHKRTPLHCAVCKADPSNAQSLSQKGVDDKNVEVNTCTSIEEHNLSTRVRY